MSINRILARYKWSFFLTLLLVLLDAALLVLFPLFIGYTIDDALEQNYLGALWLGMLGLGSLAVGAGRRWYDSRFYARVYEQLGAEVGSKSHASTSTKTAHLGFLSEVVEFFENTVPGIINSSIGLLGTLAILATMELRIFAGCLVILLIIVIVYGASEKKTLRFNASYNHELEQQVTMVTDNHPLVLRGHLKRLMRWNILLSDLETINFSIIWLVMMVFLVLSIITVVSEGLLAYGAVFALILYLFQFIESVSVMPFFYQQWLRLTEITHRLRKI